MIILPSQLKIKPSVPQPHTCFWDSCSDVWTHKWISNEGPIAILDQETTSAIYQLRILTRWRQRRVTSSVAHYVDCWRSLNLCGCYFFRVLATPVNKNGFKRIHLHLLNTTLKLNSWMPDIFAFFLPKFFLNSLLDVAASLLSVCWGLTRTNTHTHTITLSGSHTLFLP